MSYESNLNSVVVDLTKRLDGFLVDNKVVQTVAEVLQASNIVRIHTDGKAVDGSDIGKYSTKPMLAGRKTFVTKAGFNKIAGSKAKRRKLDWRKVKEKNLFIIQGGYKEYRELDGRNKKGGDKSKVILFRKGNLEKSFVANAKGNDWVVGFNSSDANDIRLGQEKKWGKVIWGESKADTKIIDEILKNARIS